jgi:outer membrane protein, multidrug efflux system
VKKIFFFLFFSGCMVGPNYQQPKTDLPSSFTEAKEEETTLVSDQELLRWWKQFKDPLLDELLEEAARANFDLRVAMQQIEQARAQYLVQAAQLFPQIDAIAAATRTRNSLDFLTGGLTPTLGTPSAAGAATTSTPQIQNLYQAGFDAIWEIDFFGKIRRAKRAAHFNWEALEEHARDVQITILSEVARNYMTLIAVQKKIDLGELLVDVDKEQFFLTRDLFEAGLKSESDVQAALAFLDTDQADLEVLISTFKQTLYSLAVLIGKQPEAMADKLSDFAAYAHFPLSIAQGKIPSSLPSELLRRRPDIRAAERQLAAATEQIGVAVADLFPQVSLTSTNILITTSPGSNFGFASHHLSRLFTSQNQTWSVGPAFNLPLLDFGKRRATVKVQTAIQKEALITYEKIVTTALSEVESTLVAYFKEQQRFFFLENQVHSTERSLELSEERYLAGLNDYIAVLEAKKQWILSNDTLVDSMQASLSDLIAVYKALGGEWECLPTP